MDRDSSKPMRWRPRVAASSSKTNASSTTETSNQSSTANHSHASNANTHFSPDRRRALKALATWAVFTVAGWISLPSKLQLVQGHTAWTVFTHCIGASIFMLVVTQQTRWLPISAAGGIMILLLGHLTGTPDDWIALVSHAFGYMVLIAMAVMFLGLFGGMLYIWTELIRFVKRLVRIYPDAYHDIQAHPVLQKVVISFPDRREEMPLEPLSITTPSGLSSSHGQDGVSSTIREPQSSFWQHSRGRQLALIRENTEDSFRSDKLASSFRKVVASNSSPNIAQIAASSSTPMNESCSCPSAGTVQSNLSSQCGVTCSASCCVGGAASSNSGIVVSQPKTGMFEQGHDLHSPDYILAPWDDSGVSCHFCKQPGCNHAIPVCSEWNRRLESGVRSTCSPYTSLALQNKQLKSENEELRQLSNRMRLERDELKQRLEQLDLMLAQQTNSIQQMQAKHASELQQCAAALALRDKQHEEHVADLIRQLNHQVRLGKDASKA
eukprot:TRINITY_DN8881_c0_g1_i1.p1 TRINITY_DN8881_c0_g1~~TRINITY_DN8881_c0_g1_i1.p1  ORF type:complete len:495 (-),score=87.04 TRINITY_DN8881_c0_g1_i1:62-1546(-)